jgi:hypothetical protein
LPVSFQNKKKKRRVFELDGMSGENQINPHPMS